MAPKNSDLQVIDLDAYLKLFEPYDEQLRDFNGREREYGGRFALLFRQVVRLLVVDADINLLVPKMYVVMAQRYLDRDPDTVRHFAYEDNRHFFLSELRDWIAVQERGRAMRRLARNDKGESLSG